MSAFAFWLVDGQSILVRACTWTLPCGLAELGGQGTRPLLDSIMFISELLPHVDSNRQLGTSGIWARVKDPRRSPPKDRSETQANRVTLLDFTKVAGGER